METEQVDLNNTPSSLEDQATIPIISSTPSPTQHQHEGVVEVIEEDPTPCTQVDSPTQTEEIISSSSGMEDGSGQGLMHHEHHHPNYYNNNDAILSHHNPDNLQVLPPHHDPSQQQQQQQQQHGAPLSPGSTNPPQGGINALASAASSQPQASGGLTSPPHAQHQYQSPPTTYQHPPPHGHPHMGYQNFLASPQQQQQQQITQQQVSPVMHHSPKMEGQQYVPTMRGPQGQVVGVGQQMSPVQQGQPGVGGVVGMGGVGVVGGMQVGVPQQHVGPVPPGYPPHPQAGHIPHHGVGIPHAHNPVAGPPPPHGVIVRPAGANMGVVGGMQVGVPQPGAGPSSPSSANPQSNFPANSAVHHGGHHHHHHHHHTGSANPKIRAKRHKWEGDQLKELEAFFLVNQKPSAEDIEHLSTKIREDASIIKTWFANRRAKERKGTTSTPGQVKISSQTVTQQGLPAPGQPQSQTLTQLQPQQQQQQQMDHTHHHPHHHHHQQHPGVHNPANNIPPPPPPPGTPTNVAGGLVTSGPNTLVSPGTPSSTATHPHHHHHHHTLHPHHHPLNIALIHPMLDGAIPNYMMENDPHRLRQIITDLLKTNEELNMELINRKRQREESIESATTPTSSSPNSSSFAAASTPPAKKIKLEEEEDENEFYKMWCSELQKKMVDVKFSQGIVEQITVDSQISPSMFCTCFEDKMDQDTLLRMRGHNMIGNNGNNKGNSSDNIINNGNNNTDNNLNKVQLLDFDTYEKIEDIFGEGNIKQGGWVAFFYSNKGPQPKKEKTTAKIEGLKVEYHEAQQHIRLYWMCRLEHDTGFDEDEFINCDDS